MIKLKELRLAAGLSQQALFEKSGVSVRTIQDVEARGDCRMSTAYLLAQALGCSLDDLWDSDK